MKRAVVLAATVFLSCATNTHIQPAWLSQWFECAERGIACNDQIETSSIAANSARVRREGSQLHLGLGKAADRIFTDASSDDASAQIFRYLGELTPFPYSVVHVSYYEGDEFLLIHHQDGSLLRVPAVPVSSPDGRRIAVSSGMNADYNPNRLEIWQRRGTHLEREWMFEPKEWAAQLPKWINESEFHACKVYFTLEEMADPQCRCEPIVVTFSAGQWIVRDDSSCPAEKQ